MIKFAICEDEIIQAEINQDYIKRWADKNNIEYKIDIFESAEKFLFSWQYEEVYDVIILDIRMKSMSGMELARNIRLKDSDVIIIFISGLDDYVFDGYNVSAFNYLLKPINDEKIFNVLDRVKEKLEKDKNAKQFLLLSKGKNIFKIDYDDIFYIIAFDHYIDIHSKNEIYTFNRKISQLEELLPKENFVRCHRSYIVNIKYVKNINKNSLLLEDDIKIPISKTRMDNTYNTFINYFAKTE
ncbi:MAG: LytTR family DNA-binding domain-containing protein [Clostridium sp.]|nr:LytTR family DNA-binding domain-containing protein [Clostridium sp.]